MRIYFDCCCYNRPFDNPSSNRIHDETEAVLSLINRCLRGNGAIIGSTILQMEIDKINDPRKKYKVLSLYQANTLFIPYTESIKNRAIELCSKTSIRLMDSLHIASAESGNADVFLSTDDKLVRACSKLQLQVRVMNPATYLAEVIANDRR